MNLSFLPIIYLILILIIPIGSLLATSNVQNFWSLATEPIALSAYQVTFSMALVASLVNGIFGFLLAWVLVRYDFPGKKMLDAAIDLPFALPTSVAGLTLATIYSPKGWIAGITLSFSRAIGEYGSVVVMASNIPLKDLIASVLVFQKLEQYETLGATVIGTVVLLISLTLLFAVQIIQNILLIKTK